MGSIWLRELPRWLRDAGLEVDTWPGWETRARSSGGYDSIMAVGIHHDAWPMGRSLEDRCEYEWENASSRPIGAMHLHTDGRVMIGAAGATNTQGKGGPYLTSKGIIPQDSGNRNVVSIEASNNGIGEPWPEVQQNAYVLLCAALCHHLDLNPATDVIAHFEWAPGRKIDPAGPSRYATGSSSWDMRRFRNDVVSTHFGGSIMASDITFEKPPQRILDSRLFGEEAGRVGSGRPGDDGVRTIRVPGALGKVAAKITVTLVRPNVPSYATVWDAGSRPGTSCCNSAPGFPAIANTTDVVLRDGMFQLYVSGDSHVLLDLVGLWS